MCRIYAKYKDAKQRISNEIKREKESIHPLKAMLRQGVITLKEYEPKRHDITHRIKDWDQKLYGVESECLNELSEITGTTFLGMDQIAHYIYKYKKRQ